MREDLSVSTKVSAVTDGDQEAGKPGPHEAGLQALCPHPRVWTWWVVGLGRGGGERLERNGWIWFFHL